MRAGLSAILLAILASGCITEAPPRLAIDLRPAETGGFSITEVNVTIRLDGGAAIAIGLGGWTLGTNAGAVVYPSVESEFPDAVTIRRGENATGTLRFSVEFATEGPARLMYQRDGITGARVLDLHEDGTFSPRPGTWSTPNPPLATPETSTSHVPNP